MKEEVIRMIVGADIARITWAEDILETISDKYAKGYLSCALGEMGGVMETTCEDFRENFIVICNYDIWGK